MYELSKCPRCDKAIYPNAKKCVCGWREPTKKEDKQREIEIVPCAHFGCGYRAIINQKTPTGRANLCFSHYMQYYQKLAEDYCHEKDLTTRNKMREYGLTLIKSFTKKITKAPVPCLREPGEDPNEDIEEDEFCSAI